MGRAMSAGLDHQVDIVAPFLTLAKADVIRLGTDLGVPFEYTDVLRQALGWRCHEEFKPDLPSEGYLHPHELQA